MPIAYLINRYPSVSHTFIRREIHALERAGINVRRFTVRASPHGHVDEDDAREAEQTITLLDGKLGLIKDTLAAAFASPTRFASALALALRSAARTSRGPRHLAYLAEACRLARLCRDGGVSHLHAHFGTNPAAVARLCRRLGGPPYSFTIHGPDEWDDPTPGGLDLAGKAAEAEFVAVISHYTGAQLRRWAKPEDWHKIHVVRCGVDKGFQAEPPPLDPQSRTLVCVGRLAPQKGQLLLLEAFAEAIRSEPADVPSPARLVLVGDGELRPPIERRIAELNLQSRVEITGWVDAAEIRRRLASARALVLPSFAEGLPVVIMEALAMARPVITTAIAGIPELVKDGENGWLVPAGDTAAAADAIRACLSADADTLAAMGRRGREAVLDRHAADRAAAPLADLIRGSAADATPEPKKQAEAAATIRRQEMASGHA